MVIKATITHEGLITSFRKGLRNGNWRKLNFLDKALFRAAMWYAKRGVSIVNEMLVEKLLGLGARLKETKGMRIFKRGDLKRRLRCWIRGTGYMGTEAEILVERAGLCVLAGDGAVKR